LNHESAVRPTGIAEEKAKNTKNGKSRSKAEATAKALDSGSEPGMTGFWDFFAIC